MTKRQTRVEVETELGEDGANVHTLTFSNGEKRVVAFEAEHKLAQKFRAYGERAKLLAAANGVEDVEEAVGKVDKLVEQFDAGKWSLLGEGGPKYTPLVRAIAEIKGIECDVAQKLVAGMSKSAQAKLRSTERVATIIARLKKGETKDGDALLDALGKEEEEEEDQSEAA